MPTTSNFGWTTPADTDLVKDGALAIRTLGNGIDTSLLDLKGGTTGQILSKASNTDLDYTWINNDVGDITNVGVTAPITGGGSSGSVTIGIDDGTTAQKGAVQLEDSTSSTSTTKAATPNSVKSAYDLANAAIAKSLIDAEGDLIVGDAADAVQRLAIGSNGNVLTVDTSVDGKIKWAAPAGGGANWSLLNTGGTALTGATSITVSSISAADKIMVLIAGASADASAGFYLRLNADSGNNYSRFGYESSGTIDVSNQSATSGIALCDLSNNAASVAAGYYLFSGCNASGLKIYNSVGSANAAGGSGQKTFMQGGFYNSASTISSVTLHSTSGNFDAGTIYVYTSA